MKEPNCAILDAVKSGKILTERWRSYQSLLNELDAPKY
jgi:putative ribosome biogenesis GTPase RsgA